MAKDRNSAKESEVRKLARLVTLRGIAVRRARSKAEQGVAEPTACAGKKGAGKAASYQR